ncbi:hypothetical protein HN954_04365 [bacterium]|nr:hypothetical protein [bacterium]MBT6831938.1 hypothetical protein [bacterium]MBT6996634.1 hypothetical protein [bacterium]MBT7773054.1 hypothetical protein [bacterium]
MFEFFFTPFFTPEFSSQKILDPVTTIEVSIDKTQKIPDSLRTILRAEKARKSVVVEEFAKFADTQLPDHRWGSDFSVKLFADISADASHDLPARKLRSLGVLPDEPRFGTLSNPNPSLERDEISRLANKTFSATNFSPLPSDDPDRDGFPSETDFCPKVSGEADGCPAIEFFPNSEKSGVEISIKNDRDFEFIETEEIRVGDIFRAVIRDPRSGEIFSTSEPVEVKR